MNKKFLQIPKRTLLFLIVIVVIIGIGVFLNATRKTKDFKEVNGINQNVVVNDSLEEAIHLAVLEYNKNESMLADLACEDHIILTTKEDEKKQTMTVYAMVLYEEYELINGQIEDTTETRGSYIPTALTFDKKGEKQYILSEYWVPGDGSDYAPDIKKKFPKEVVEDAINNPTYINYQKQNIYQELMKEGYLDAEKMITKAINHIIQIKDTAPDWEIAADQRDLTYYGDAMLTYAYKHFLKGQQTEEKAYIMETACRDILKQFQEDMAFGNKKGQEWFDAYLSALKEYEETKGIEFVKENMPKGYLLLMMNEE